MEDHLLIPYSFLTDKKKVVPKLSSEEEKELIKLSSRFSLSSLILDFNSFSEANNFLMNKLLFEQKISIIKQMSTEKDLKTIINKFESTQVEMIVLKGNALILKKLINSRLRQTKDIDILIDKENLPKAYIKLRELGYRYINPFAKDAANVL